MRAQGPCLKETELLCPCYGPMILIPCVFNVASNEILCIGPLRGLLCLQPFYPDRQKPCCFSQLDVIWISSWLWYCSLGSSAWGLGTTLLRRNPPLLKYSSRTSAATRGSPGSPLAPLCTPYQSCCGELFSSVCLWS